MSCKGRATGVPCDRFGSQPTERRLRLSILVGATLLSCIVAAFTPSNQEKTPISLVHEKDIQIGRGGVNAFAWSPDSRFIAFVRWEGGSVAIAEVESGKVTELPGSQMNGLTTLAWSQDSQQIAMTDGRNLRVIRTDDFHVALEFRGTGDVAFESVAAFSEDGKGVLLQSGARRDILLYRVDLETGMVEPFLRSPNPAPRHSSVRQGHFQWVRGQLYFSVLIESLAEEFGTLKTPESAELRFSVVHPSCHVFVLGNSEAVTASKTIDLTVFAKENINESGVKRNIVDCQYSGPSGLVMIECAGPQAVPGAAQDPSKDRVLGSFELASRLRVAEFGGPTEPEEGKYGGSDVHPTQPWATTTSPNFLTVWDLYTGQALARTKMTPPIYTPRISPDGKRLAIWTPRSLPIFRIN